MGKNTNAKSPYLIDCNPKLNTGQTTSQGSVMGNIDLTKSTQSKISNHSSIKASIDDPNRSLGRSSTGTRTTSNDRVLKLKIKSSKGSKEKMGVSQEQSAKNQKIIATI